jgi:glycosyltransferase involved in cell wall biosynthesis
VVDGQSSEGTAEIIRKLPVKILADPGNGQNLAHEIGWRSTEGDLIIFLDADAYLGEGFFPAIFEFFKDEKLGLAGCPGRFVGTGKLHTTVEEWNVYDNRVRTQPKGPIEKAHRAIVWRN